MRYLRRNTATVITIGPFLDVTDGITPEVGLTVTGCHLTLLVDNMATGLGTPTLALDADATASGGNNDMVHITGDDAGYYSLELTQANTNYLGGACLTIINTANHLPVFHEFTILPTAIYDGLIEGGTLTLGALTVSGATTLTGNVSLGGTLAVTGASTLASLAVTGAATIGDGVAVTCTTTNRAAIKATGNGSGAGFEVVAGTGNALTCGVANIGAITKASEAITGNLSVGGTTTLTGAFVASDASNHVHVDVVKWRETAVSDPDTEGVPDVNVKTWANVAAAASDVALSAAPTNFESLAIAVGGTVTATLSAGAKTDINAEVDTALSDINLDHLCGTATGIPTLPADTWLDTLLDSGGANVYDRTTDSLQAFRDSTATAANVADAVWDEARSGHTTGGTFGAGVTGIAAGGIVAASFGAGAIDAAAIAANAIGATQVATGAIVAETFAAGAINAAAIAADAIGSSELAADAATEVAAAVWNAARATYAASGSFGQGAASVIGNVGGNVDGSVGSVVGAVASVTNGVTVAALGSGVITAISIASNAITAEKLAGDCITSAKIADDAIAAEHLADDAITAASIATGAITSDALHANAIDLIWDEAASGHTTSGTFGQSFQVIRTGTAQAGAAGSITLDASASAVDAFYNGAMIHIVGGTGVGQVRKIDGYTGSTKVATVSTNWATNPASNSVFIIYPRTVESGTGATAQQVWEYATRAVTDKAGFSLAADQSAVTVGTVTALTGNTAQTGDVYALANGAHGFVSIQDDVDAILADTGTDGVVVAATSKTGYTLTGNQTGVTIPTVTTLTGHTAQTGDVFALANGDHGFVSIQDDVDAILADTGTDGVVVAAASKTGYLLAATQTGVTIPTVTTVGTVTTLTGHTAQTGDVYALANGVAGFVATKADTAAILADTGTDGVVVATASKTGYALTGAQTGVTIPTVTTLTTWPVISHKINTAWNGFTYVLTDDTTHAPVASAAGLKAYRRIDGGTEVELTGANAPSELANGHYKCNLPDTALNGHEIVLRFTGTDCDDTIIKIVTQGA